MPLLSAFDQHGFLVVSYGGAGMLCVMWLGVMLCCCA